MTKLRTVSLGLVLLTMGACTVEEYDAEYRVLPVAAVTPEGSDVLVGTYDESTREVTLVPTFLAELEASAGMALSLRGADDDVPLAAEVAWPSELTVGDILRIVPRDGDGVLTGARLVVHDESWIDRLTEAEAVSAFAACWDPDPCWTTGSCACWTTLECEPMSQELSFRKSYPYMEVWAACDAAYDYGNQVEQCIVNVCGFYGCK